MRRRKSNNTSSSNTTRTTPNNNPKSSKSQEIINSLQSKIDKNGVISENDIKKLKQNKEQNHLFKLSNANGTQELTILIYLITKNQYENVTFLFQGNNTPDSLICNSRGDSALHFAITAYHLRSEHHYDLEGITDVIDTLLKHKAKEQMVLLSRLTDRNPLQEAVCYQNESLIAKLCPISVEQFLQLNARHDKIALMMAIILKNESIFNLLLEKGPVEQLLVKNKDGFLSIHLACEIGNLPFVEQLLKHKTEEQLRSEDKKDRCPLAIAALEGHLHIIKYLLTTYSDITSKQRQSALLWACRGWQQQTAEYLITSLKNQPSAFLIQGENNFSLLMFLAIPSRACITEYNISRQETPSIIQDEESLSMYTKDILRSNEERATQCNLAIARSLLSQENVNEQLLLVGKYGNVLHIAIKQNDIEYIKLLVTYEIQELFLTYDSKGRIPLSTAFVVESCKQKMQITELLLKTKFAHEQLNHQDRDGLLPIHYACDFGLIDCVKYIIEQDPKQLNIITRDGGRYSPLHLAVMVTHSNKRELIQFLLNQGADVLATDAEQCNPLHRACEQGNLEVVKLFLVHPRYTEKLLALLAAKDIDGNTPLHYACEHDNLELVKFLITKGANVNQQNLNGFSAFHFACIANKNLFVKYFLTLPELNDPDMLGPILAIYYNCKSVLEEFDLNEHWKEKIDELKKSIAKNHVTDSPQPIITAQADTQFNTSSQWEPNSSFSKGTSGYQFLKDQGYSLKEIKELVDQSNQDSEKKSKKCALFQVNNITPSSFTYFNGSFSTDGLFTIENQAKTFLYLDEDLLKVQGETLGVNILENLPSRFIINDQHIRPLDSNISVIEDEIILPNRGSKKITYSHEWKFYMNGLENFRVLLFPITADGNKAVIYVTGHVIEALHTKGKIKNLENRKNPAPVSINWNCNNAKDQQSRLSSTANAKTQQSPLL